MIFKRIHIALFHRHTTIRHAHNNDIILRLPASCRLVMAQLQPHRGEGKKAERCTQLQGQPN